MDNVKRIIIAVWGALMSFLGILAVPVLLMVACNIIDYITGIMASAYRDEPLSSYKGMKGIIKKVSMWLLVVIGAIVDKLIEYASTTVGIDIHFTFLIASVVAIWIVCNEILSILENISDIGVKLPPFLKPIVEKLKNGVEDKAGVKDGDNE